jgi:hypothetical protein
MKLFRLPLAVLALTVLWPGPALAQLQLLMFEQPGCSYCAQWTRQIGPIYPKTTEGKSAPLQQIDIHSPLPAGISLRSSPVFTPTFVLLQDGAEVGRIEGYPGQDFFWGLLGQMIAKTQ